jgi:hypothetical protein
MHFQLLIDNTRQGIVGGLPAFSEQLAAELVHSLLFHENVGFLDDFVVNNPAIRQVIANYPAAAEAFRFPNAVLYRDERFTSLADKMELSAPNDAFHFVFGSADKFLADKEKLCEFFKPLRVINYNHVKLRQNFTTEFLKFLSSPFAVEQLQGFAGELVDLLHAYLAYKKSITPDLPNVLRQSDFEGGTRRQSRIAEFVLARSPHVPLASLEGKLQKLAQYSYRYSLTGVDQAPAIMHDEHTATYRQLNNHMNLISLARTGIRVESPFFHTRNLLKLDIDDVLEIRGRESFIKYQQALAEYSPTNIDAGQRHLGLCLEEHIKSINSYIKDRLSPSERVSLPLSHSVIDFGIAVSTRTAAEAARMHGTMKKAVSRVELVLRISDFLHNSGFPLPGANSFMRQGVSYTLKASPYVPFELAHQLGGLSTALLDRVQRIFGDPIHAEVFPDDHNSGYGAAG